MGLREGDLKDTILKKISLDEFEPKTGDSKDVIVAGFLLKDKAVGEDLNSFLSSSRFYKNIRDIEISPNRNDDGYFMLFMEIDRNEHSLGYIKEIVKDISRVAGNLKWEASTHLTDDFYPLESEELTTYFISNPEKYMTREEYEQQQASVELESNVYEFLKHSDCESVVIEDNNITLKGRGHSATLEIVKFGKGTEAMKEVGIHESAIEEMDMDVRAFNQMLGGMRALRIAENIVIFNPKDDTVLITK